MSPKSRFSEISYRPVVNDPSASYHLIYFITGNPGLIAYYDTFLATLYDSLSRSKNQSSNYFHIHGQSLAGFEEEEPELSSPYSLEDQITISLTSLQRQRIPSGALQGQPYASVILIGHSVGSYILLELIQRLRKSSSSLNIRAGILLFPTVTHLAQSPSGVKISRLFRIPDFAKRASSVAKALVSIAPKSVLKWLVGLLTGMPNDSAEVTTRFLRSSMGIWQALHLAKDEIDFITEDKWDEDIWGIEHEETDQKPHIPKLIFYFGEKDHWVANHTRDALIAARGRIDIESSSSKPVMLIDENGVEHGFCIRHSESIAEKVKIWIENAMDGESEA
ncbi:uncharacterized protein LY89DRAFT_622679 [Mollisia scopiformis]|uniref:Lipid droplet-associated hydrolase n=1 Tax=Mollisia scopiformis TaxID=149040 RepID=A0A194WYQ0_MOLSC|nr:uncharacterized protein LY89DRAFT_622679 [Mollisia scopiformis]KUJ12727.1 hypothetical protein LY89DRAFT_622679 [Mollisia scopiformis]